VKKKQKNKKMERASERDETSNSQIEKSKPGDHDPDTNEEAKKDLNEHTKRDNE
jgi:hypothetical protein